MESAVTTGPWTGMVMSPLCPGTRALSFSTIRVTNNVFPIPARLEDTTLTHDLWPIKLNIILKLRILQSRTQYGPPLKQGSMGHWSFHVVLGMMADVRSQNVFQDTFYTWLDQERLHRVYDRDEAWR